MKINSKQIRGRQGWMLENDRMEIFLMAGGGNIAGLRLKEKIAVNPYWAPPWKSMEPWEYKEKDAKQYAIRLLACISGHNLCLSGFGDPSVEEAKCGLTCHYEAPVARWSVIRKNVSARRLDFEYGCKLPVAQMSFTRLVSMKAGSNIVSIRETVENMSRRDLPFTMCQHVTFGPPFVEPGVTIFDAPATRGHTFPTRFASPQRLKIDAEYRWPYGPGAGGRVDLRFHGRERYGDYTANLMDLKKEHAWFSAVNPRLGLMVAYVWRRADFPWLGIWEENRARKASPWKGKTTARGMEFANSPFPLGLRKAVDLGKFHGQRTYAWLPARGNITIDYSILAGSVGRDCGGVKDILPDGGKFNVKLPGNSRRIIT
jgi:hypothetical protein